MCCLFGVYNYGGKEIKDLHLLTKILSEEATARGSDATGIAFNSDGKLKICKEAKSAYEVDFKHPDNVICVMGHTRHATQGAKEQNYNNHPFMGHCKGLKFALAHNGVLTNDDRLREEYLLPKTKIKTDSYIAVQMIEKQGKLNTDSLKFMAEKVQGSFAFTVLDSNDNLHIVRGDSPLSLVHFPRHELYVYASTEPILYRALIDTNLFKEVKSGNFEEIEIQSGDILTISQGGNIAKEKFNFTDYSTLGYCRWWERELGDGTYDSYVMELKDMAAYFGYTAEDVDELLASGFSPEEIEEYLYCMEE